jgi:hypothetical protein
MTVGVIPVGPINLSDNNPEPRKVMKEAASGADYMGGLPTDQLPLQLGRFDECRNEVRRLFETSAEPRNPAGSAIT